MRLDPTLVDPALYAIRLDDEPPPGVPVHSTLVTLYRDDYHDMEVPPGTVTFVVGASEPNRSIYTVGLHKDYETERDSNILVYDYRHALLTGCGPSDVRVGDLVAVRTVNGKTVGIVTAEDERYLVLSRLGGDRVLAHVGATDTIGKDQITHIARCPASVAAARLPREQTSMTIESTITQEVGEETIDDLIRPPRTLCQDPAHEAIVAQVQEKDSTIDRQRETIRRFMADAHTISDALGDFAAENDMVAEVTAMIRDLNNRMRKANLTPPKTTFNVRCRVEGSTPTNVYDKGLVVEVSIDWRAMTDTFEVEAESDDDVDPDWDEVFDSIDWSTLEVRNASVGNDSYSTLVDDVDGVQNTVESEAAAHEITDVEIAEVSEVE